VIMVIRLDTCRGPGVFTAVINPQSTLTGSLSSFLVRFASEAARASQNGVEVRDLSVSTTPRL
jgi:hypothetical protein